jgi:iron(III) transport system ATP-binding protein
MTDSLRQRSAPSDSEQGLVVQALEKTYPGEERVRAVDDVSFEVPPGGFFTLLGPSGCGKTTTMRCVAGLERPDAGSILIAGNRVSGPQTFLPTERRPIGMVFQSYAIWPHMSVFENAAFPLRVSRPRVGRREIEQRVREVLELVDLGHLASRDATQMSGGQQQRLALARALVRRPKLLLLDEPLSNLDAKLRERLRIEIRDLQRSLGITTLYVTHDQAEALSMSDKVAVMDSGRVSQLGTPREIYQRPLTSFVANFVGTCNFIDSQTITTTQTATTVDAAMGPQLLQVDQGSTGGKGVKVVVAIRPERVLLHPAGQSIGRANVFHGSVESVVYLGERLEATVRSGARRILVHAPVEQDVNVGHEVQVELPPDACTIVDDGIAPRAEMNTEVADDHADRVGV